MVLRPDDLRIKVRARPARHTILFVVDSSRSMGARARMRQTKAAVLSLLVDAHQKRDRVGLITFGKGGARLVLPPTRSVRVAASCTMADGGGTNAITGRPPRQRVVEDTMRR